MRFRHVSALLFGTPLLIDPIKLEGILRGLGDRLDLDMDVDPVSGAANDRKPYTVQDGIACIDVFGSLVQRAMGMKALSGLTSYAELGNELDQAMADPAVKAVLFRFDSPGGEAAGAFDLADKIRAASQAKPVYAIAEDKALSAAYLLASAATRLYTTQSGEVGSIGVILSHVDNSMNDAKDGRRVTTITAGARKADGDPSRPLEPEAKAALQAKVDQTYDLLVGKVAWLRGMEMAEIRDTQAAVYQGAKGVKVGLADGVTSYQELLSKLATGGIPVVKPTRDLDGQPVDAPADRPWSQQSQKGHSMLTAEEKARMDALEAENADLKAKNTKLQTKKDKWKAEAKAMADAEAQKQVQASEAEAKLNAEALKTKSVADVIEKHRARGALVPSMIPFIHSLSASGKTAEEVDKMLSAYPEHPSLKPAPAAPVSVAGVGGGDSAAFELDAEATSIAKKFGWDKKTLERYHNVTGIRVTERGAQAVLANGERVMLADLHAGRS